MSTRWYAVVLAALVALPAIAQSAPPWARFTGDPFERFLPVEQAFQLDVQALDATTVGMRWRIADEYYLYRDKFTIAGPDGVTLGALQIPTGETHTDEFFGTVQIHRRQVEVRVAVMRETDGPKDIELTLGYQGCADAGLCYPPDWRVVTVTLPAVGSVPDAPVWVSEQDRLAGLLADGRLWLVVLTFFGLGLLLTFTPCVLPMVPILSGIIIGQGPGLSARRGFMLSLVYVLAMALTYTAAGVLAALLGHNLQAVFQQPAVLITFAAVFVLLALAMFGFYRFEMPAAVQARLAALSNRQRSGTWAGVAAMGFLSALIVGPCVAAPLAGALIYIGQTGDAVLGGVALFSLSMGMGTLLLVIGASAGRLMPKAGPWMDAVKAFFGVLMLAVAIWLLERVLPAPVTMAMWAALAVVSGIYMGALDAIPAGSTGWRKLWKGVGLLAIVWGVLLLVGAASGGRDALQPLRGSALVGGGGAAIQAEPLPFRTIKSVADLERELALATDNDRPVMLDFYADWCVSCKEMERYTFSDAAVRAALADAVLLKADVTRHDAVDRELMRSLDVIGPPSILFFGADGEERRRFRVVGFVPADAFTELLGVALER